MYSNEADAARAADAAWAERGEPRRNAALLAQVLPAEAPVGGAAAAAAAASPPRQLGATAAADAAAAPQSTAPSSVFSGVGWNKRDKKWQARIYHAGMTM